MRLRHASEEGETIGGEGDSVGAVFILNVLNKIFITFILATTFAVAEKDLDVNLPEAKSGREEMAETKEVVINVLRDGRLKLGEAYYELDELVERLKQVALANAQVPVTIRGDRQTMFENAVRAMDACGRANLHRISFAIVDSGA